MSTRIFVKNLPKDATQEKLVAHIKNSLPAAVVTDCQLKYTREGVFRRFAFVGFNSAGEAEQAQAKLNGTFMKTTKIQVDLAGNIGDSNVRAWSKYSAQNQAKDGKGKPGAAKQEDKEEKKPARSGFVLKIKGLSGFYNEKSIREFFKPIKLSSIRIPRSAQKKPMGVAFAEFPTAKDLEQGMGKNKNFINGKKIFLKKAVDTTAQAAKPLGPAPWELKKKTSGEQEVESIADSGRLFVRNLWFGITEEELSETFGKFGPLAEVILPVDTLTKKVKGFAHIVFVFPEHALKAFTELDYTSLHGRLMHILPGREGNTDDGGTDEKSSYKKKKAAQQKANSSSAYNWNTLFLGANAVADAMAKKYNTEKSNILDSDSKGSLGVRMALGETQIVSETRQFLISNGVALDSFSQAAGERSKTVILVKNLPSGVKPSDLEEVFGQHGTLGRVLMPPSGITAIVEYIEPSEARKGFMKLNFSKFRSIPLYLEWAPMGVFTTPAKASKDKTKEAEKDDKEETLDDESKDNEGEEMEEDKEVATKDADKTKEESNNNKQEDGGEDEDEEDSEEEPEENTTLFVKNLNFDTTDESLTKHFEALGQIHSATVAKKKDAKRPGELLSQGFGFVQYMKQKDAKEAIKRLQNSELDGHNLELKLSSRTTTQQAKGRKKQGETKQTSTKILVRNIPFEAKRREIEELFKVFGELKFVRLPKKLGGTGPHRGFAFVDFLTKHEAKRAFNALCHSTHLYGRRLVLEWAAAEESLEELRQKTAQHFSDDGPRKKVSKLSLKNELEG